MTAFSSQALSLSPHHGIARKPVEKALAFDVNNIDTLTKPSWWEGFVTASQEHLDGLSATPEMLDIIESPQGDLAVVWQPAYHYPQDIDVDTESVYYKRLDASGLSLHDVSSGEVIGSVVTECMTDASFARAYGDDEFAALRFPNRVFDDYEDMLRQFNRMNSTKRAEVARWRVFYSSSSPSIRQSYINEDYRGQGLGTAMYIYASKRLGLEGKTLRASIDRTDDSKAVWARMEQNFPEHVITLDWKIGGEPSTALDFRTKS
jgi:GNAT superfamily N-acetyltransferase